MPDKPRSSWRDFARYAPYPLVGGAVIGMAMARWHFDVRMMLHGAFIGLTCYGLSFLAEHLFHNWLGDKAWRRALVYFTASQIGWPLGLYGGVMLIWGEPPTAIRLSRMAWAITIGMGSMGTLAGLAVYGYERLKDRLRVSIEQLKEKEFADKELQLARELQSRMLPAQEIAADGYRITSRNFAARYVAGDFYDVFQYGDGTIGIAIADVAGKGLAASLIMASVKAVLPLLAANRSVAEAMHALNEKLVGELSKREFVAMTLARYDPSSGQVSFANAGLPDPYLLDDGRLDTVVVTGPRLPLGLKRGVRYEQTELSLAGGASMLFFSDGLPESTASDGELLGYERLADLVRAAGPDVDEIMRRIHADTSVARDDDQTLVLLQRM